MAGVKSDVACLGDRRCLIRADAQVVFARGFVGVAVGKPRRERQIERAATEQYPADAPGSSLDQRDEEVSHARFFQGEVQVVDDDGLHNVVELGREPCREHYRSIGLGSSALICGEHSAFEPRNFMRQCTSQSKGKSEQLCVLFAHDKPRSGYLRLHEVVGYRNRLAVPRGRHDQADAPPRDACEQFDNPGPDDRLERVRNACGPTVHEASSSWRRSVMNIRPGWWVIANGTRLAITTA
jgi:hypothetical protein